MELFQVTLKRGEDIQAFYDDMETPGGALHIPERKVECANRRPTSRTTGYMLTIEEAKQVAADDRVEQVVPQSIIDMTKEKEEAIFTGRFAKGLAGSDYTIHEIRWWHITKIYSGSQELGHTQTHRKHKQSKLGW